MLLLLLIVGLPSTRFVLLLLVPGELIAYAVWLVGVCSLFLLLIFSFCIYNGYISKDQITPKSSPITDKVAKIFIFLTIFWVSDFHFGFGEYLNYCHFLLAYLSMTCSLTQNIKFVDLISSHCCFRLFQMIHFITMALGGEGYLNFMGNEVSTFASMPPANLLMRCSRTLKFFNIKCLFFLFSFLCETN